MKPIIAIDPGTEKSAVIIWDGKEISHARITENIELIGCIRCSGIGYTYIEMVASYGMPVGKEIFETCVWIGRFIEAFPGECELVYRKDVKLHHCGSARAKDGNVAQVLRDKYGGKGTKKKPGVTYGLHSHLWQAFAIATYVTERKK